MQKLSNKNLYYFKFDALTHYQTSINAADLEELEFKAKPNEQDLLLHNILFKNHPPKNIDDTVFIETLQKLGFQKKVIEAKHFEAINEIFKAHKNQNIQEPFCGAVYRDVLVFHHQNKIIGVAKLCFSCGHHYIIGTEKDTTNFSANGTFKKLKHLLTTQINK